MFWLIHSWLWGSIGIVLLLLLQFLANLPVLVRLRSGPVSEKCPPVSVLVPARNEAKRIGPCLQSLLAQDYPHFECIVLDDQSDDGTANLVEQLGFSTDPAARFRLIGGPPLTTQLDRQTMGLPSAFPGRSWGILVVYRRGYGSSSQHHLRGYQRSAPGTLRPPHCLVPPNYSDLC
jgi:cellulose synthase/poly-beta-1,6-N-acetylglucosamine synthase-like glycosyltransferase